MSHSSRLLALTGMLLFSFCTASVARASYSDPSGRVARLNHSQGDVSYSPAGEDEWLNVERNRPLIRGDRLWTDSNARVELQMGSAAIRLGPDTSFEILDLSDRIAQVQVTEGTINLRVRRMYPGQIYEVATPTLAFTISRAGRYRIDVDPYDNETTIVVWEGAGEAYGDNAEFPLGAGDTVRFYSADLRDYEMFGLPRADAFDRYCFDRDLRMDRSASLRYISDDVVGYADLDAYGSWRPVSNYGNVWFPNRVDANWAPYRDGRWLWQEPWGWTWLDDAPWGFAPSHYGRWAYMSNRWGWIPGPRNVRSIYAPALVAFVGGRGWSVSLSLGGGSAPIGWFPLGPREVYVPSYQASRDYFTRVNVNNTVINNTTITNVYNNYSSGTINVNQVNYANRTVAGAVTAVPSSAFVNARPVREAAIRLDPNAASTGQITRIAPIAPSARSVLGSGTAARARPTREVSDRRVFARNAPPPSERPFAARQQQLQRNPGRALEPRAIESTQNRSADGTQNVSVISEQPGAVNAREAGPRRGRGRDKPAPGAAKPGPLPALDRSAEPGTGPAREPIERNRDGEPRIQGEATLPPERSQQAAAQQRAERQRLAESQAQQENMQAERARDQQAAEQQRAEAQRLTEAQTQLEQRAAERVRAQQAVEQQQAERQSQAGTQTPQVPPPAESVRNELATEQQGMTPERQAERQAQREQRQLERERRAAIQQQQECLRQRAIAQQEGRDLVAADPALPDPCAIKDDKSTEDKTDIPATDKNRG